MFAIPAAILLSLLIILAALVFFVVAKLLPAKLALPAAGVVLALIIICVAVPAVGKIINIPHSAPASVVDRLIDSLRTGDVASAADCFTGKIELGVENEPESDAAKSLYESLLGSWSAAETEKCSYGFKASTQRFAVRSLDIPAINESIRSSTLKKLKTMATEQPRSLVYNSDRKVKAELVQAYYEKAAAETLANASDFYMTREVEVRFECRNGVWRISGGDELLDIISGKTRAAADGASLSSVLDGYIQNALLDIQNSAEYVKKHFVIPEDALAGPIPDASKFGCTTDPMVVQAVVDSASELLEGQTLCWNPQIELMPDSEINYYCDESILVIVWREVRDGSVCTFSEVKLADASQLRRKLAGDSYGSNVWKRASELAVEANAVFACGGDLYGFRELGITSYQRQLYRFVPYNVDSCHFTASGDLMFTHSSDLATRGQAEQYIADNDILFSVAFGPVLIDNDEIIPNYWYPIGQNTDPYARCAIGQLDSLHYLVMVMSRDGEYPNNATLAQSAQAMFDKGCHKAYALDGGQTAVIIINNKIINRVTYDYERMESDIIYFATAIPENERVG